MGRKGTLLVAVAFLFLFVTSLLAETLGVLGLRH
jgi:hypothetical protein